MRERALIRSPKIRDAAALVEPPARAIGFESSRALPPTEVCPTLVGAGRRAGVAMTAHWQGHGRRPSADKEVRSP